MEDINIILLKALPLGGNPEEENKTEETPEIIIKEEENPAEPISETLVPIDKGPEEKGSSEGLLSGIDSKTLYFFIFLIVFLIILISALVVVLKKGKDKKRSITTNTPGSIPMKISVLAGKVYVDSPEIYLLDAINIGNRKGSDLRLEGVGVEPFHARIVRQNDQVFIEDLRSMSGVAIGGMRIQDRNPLRSGDIISVGEVDFSLTF